MTSDSAPLELSAFFASARINCAESAEKLKKALKTHPEWGRERDADEFTALMLAACDGAVECVNALLPFSDANAQRNDGATALMWAAGSGHAECVKALLPASDASLRDDTGSTALIWAAQNSPECVRALLPVSDASAANEAGETALIWAAMEGWLESIKAIAPFVDVKAQSNAKDNALGYAEHWEHWACADYLAAIMSLEDAEGLRKRAPKNARLPFCDALIEREALKTEVSNADILANDNEIHASEEHSERRSPLRQGARRM